MSTRPRLSVIVPFYNEEENIERMHGAIVAALEPLEVPFEMLLVNDGSRDNTLQLAIGIARRDPRVRIVNFRRNYGQTPAMAAGIEHARGEILITMDGDLQNDPADIRNFLEKMDEGSFGTCESCGNPIAEARLEAMPAAKLCIDCASKR